MLTDGRLEQFGKPGSCTVPNISGNMLFYSNLKTMGSEPSICGIAATLKFINKIASLKDREHIIMSIAKCSSSYNDGSNPNRVITTSNIGWNHIGHQLTWISNPGKSNISRTFTRAKWPDVIPKLINSFVNSVNNDCLRISLIQK